MTLNKNQIEDTSHTYDLNGNLQRFSGKNGSGHQVGAGWDERNRMRVFFEGDPHAGGSPGESYLYDASSFRLVTFDKTGVPRFSLRNGGGQALSEYLLPRGAADGVPELDRDFVYGAGQLLVERQVAAEASQLYSASPMKSGDDYALTASGGDFEASYALDISSPSGYRNQVSGIDLDSSGNFPLAESELSPDETNFLRIRMEDGAGTPYSRSVSIAYDEAVTAASPNQIRSMSVGRSGTDLVVRWNLLEENGKPTLIYFTRADTGVSYVVSPGPLAPGATALTLDSQALGTPCGSFSGTQQESDGSMTDSSIHAQIGVLDPGGLCTNPGDPPPPDDDGRVFNETFHHRDHLGSLRVAADEAGWPVRNGRLDYYPFGIRMDTGLPDATRRHYTGHEHDPDTGLEYMLARYDSTGKGRFLAVDPARDVSAAVPVSWNRYAYVRNNPVGWSDPTGAVEENQATPVTGAQSQHPDEPQLGDALTERGVEGETEKVAAEQEVQAIELIVDGVVVAIMRPNAGASYVDVDGNTLTTFEVTLTAAGAAQMNEAISDEDNRRERVQGIVSGIVGAIAGVASGGGTRALGATLRGLGVGLGLNELYGLTNPENAREVRSGDVIAGYKATTVNEKYDRALGGYGKYSTSHYGVSVPKSARPDVHWRRENVMGRTALQMSGGGG